MADEKTNNMTSARKAKQVCKLKLSSKNVSSEAKAKYKSALEKAEMVLALGKPRLVKKGKKHG
jgi:hypothetical protein